MTYKNYSIFSVMVAALFVASASAEIQKDDLPGVLNFSRIDTPAGFAGSPVGFGGATQASAMPQLRSDGFVTVINLRTAAEEGVDVDAGRAAADAVGLSYIHLPFNSAEPDPDIVDKFLAIVGDESNQPVYIHCGSATRAAALWMIGRVLEDGWETEAAAKEAEAIALNPDSAIGFATTYLASRDH
jgi:uncharacterized protein (TIGR01244 family)